MCICGSNEEFEICCGAILSHKRGARSAKELMQSRFSAYVRSDATYLLFSSVKENQFPQDIPLIEEFCANVTWLKLDILQAKETRVEFKAYYKDADGIKVLHEKSNFLQEDGVWKYKDGELYNSKVERNEVCPCGSGKKYKKCCA